MTTKKIHVQTTDDEATDPKTEPENDAQSGPEASKGNGDALLEAQHEAVEEKKADEKEDEQSYKERLQRLAAEFENFKKRTAKERAGLLDCGIERMISKLLPVLDNFDYAIESSKVNKDFEALANGIELIQKQFHEAMEQEGLKPIDVSDGRFDPRYHEVLVAEETSEHEPDTILQELQPGYLFKDRLIRPTKVKVAVAPRQSDADADAAPEKKKEPKEETNV